MAKVAFQQLTVGDFDGLPFNGETPGGSGFTQHGPLALLAMTGLTAGQWLLLQEVLVAMNPS